MITREEILMGRDKAYPLSIESAVNLGNLLTALNKFRLVYGEPMIVTSGYRPGIYNEKAKGAKDSPHLSCAACDFHDPDGHLDFFCKSNLGLLESCGLWLENPNNTPGWCHLQIRPIASGNRVFNP